MERAPEPSPRRIGRGTWALLLLPVHAALLALLALAPGLLEATYGRLYPVLSWLRLPLDWTAFSPALLILGSILFACWRREQGWRRTLLASVWRLLVATAVVVHLFPLGWGLNYLRPSAAARLGLDLSPPDPAAFAVTARAIVEATNRARVEWGEPGLLELDRAVDVALRRSLGELGLDEAAFARRTRLTPTGMMMSGGWHGVTLPWTTEAWVDPGMDRRFVPHALAHEKAHQAGFAREADANFLAWIALVRSGEPRLRYSSLFYVVDLFQPAAGVAVSAEVQADQGVAVQVAQEAVVPVVQEATHQAYDTYLKANQVEAGVADYDRVALLIHAWLLRHPETLR